MRRFQPVTFEYKDQEYTVPEDRIMGLIDAVEEHLTMGEIIADRAGRGTIRFGKLANAYAAALNYAGAQNLEDPKKPKSITPEEVYLSLWPDDVASAKMQNRAGEMMTALLYLMMPPKEVVEQDKSGNDQPATDEKAKKGSAT